VIIIADDVIESNWHGGIIAGARCLAIHDTETAERAFDSNISLREADVLILFAKSELTLVGNPTIVVP
jgi:hypothetical protein